MKKGYVISRLYWEYNDEFHYNPTDEAVTPVKVFITEDKAKEELTNLEIAEWQAVFTHDTIGSYSHDCSDFDSVSSMNFDDARKHLHTIGLDLNEWSDLSIPEDLPDEGVKIFMEVFDRISFYKIEPIDLED